MASQDWYSPAIAGSPAAAFEMRPLSTGEVLDRTFAVYRSRFWLFAGIAAISGSVQLIANAFSLLAHHLLLLLLGFRAALVATQIGSGVATLLFVLAAAVTQAATVFALSEVYLGRPASVADSLRATLGRWYRYVGIALWQGWSALWVPLLLLIPAMLFIRLKMTGWYWLAGALIFLAVFGGGAYGVIAYLRNSLAVQASVVERLKVRASMRRSKVLAAGTKGRIFVVLLIAAALFWVAAVIEAPMLFFIARTPLQEHIAAQTTMLLVSFLAHTLVSPVALIGLSLVYFDQRVRKEGFDLLMLLGPEIMGPPMTAAEPAPFRFSGPSASVAENDYAAPSQVAATNREPYPGHPVAANGETVSLEDNASAT